MAGKPFATRHLTRRAALWASGALGLVGVRLASAAPITAGPRRAGAGANQTSAGRQFAVDWVPFGPAGITAAGGGPPQRGDWFFTEARIYEAGRTDGPEIGGYQCFGAWTAAATDTTAPNQRLTTVQVHLDGIGAIMGLINEGGTVGNVGAVQGGTGDFAGALGTFTQEGLGPVGVGVNEGQGVVRGHFNLI
jgi:hypothetical protein